MTFSVPLHRVVSASEPAFLSTAVAKRHGLHPDVNNSRGNFRSTRTAF